MIKLKSLLRENFDKESLQKKIYAAGMTQRDIPETTMVNSQNIIQKAHGPAILINAIEHIGDLSHRAQTNAIEAVEDKVKMLLRHWDSNRWSLEKEINHGIMENAIFSYIQETPEVKDEYEKLKSGDRSKIMEFWNNLKNHPEVKKRIENAWSETKRALEMYTSAHEKYNKPITKLGILGKQAAIALGELDYNKLKTYLTIIDNWVKKYKSSDEDTKFKMYTDSYNDKINEDVDLPQPAITRSGTNIISSQLSKNQ